MSEGSRFYTGGLMRCCVETIARDAEPEYDGRILPCLWCSSSMRYAGDAWR